MESVSVVWYGNPYGFPLVGDWDGDGRDNVGVRQSGNVFCFRTTPTLGGSGETTVAVAYGDGSDRPVVGDWNHDGFVTQGIMR